MKISKVMALVTLGVFGCGSSNGTSPHDMSATEHEASAGAEQEEASEHARRYDPAALTEVDPVVRTTGSTS
jgi:hypothetical protein